MDDSTFEIMLLMVVLWFILSVGVGLYHCLCRGGGKGHALKENNLVKIPGANIIISPSSQVNLSARSPNRNRDKAPWWNKFDKNNIFALDAEHVYVQDVGKYEAATVSIVDFNGDPVYSRKIYHPPGSFIVDNWARNHLDMKIVDNVTDGVRIEDAKKFVLQLLEHKLVILADEWKDWNSLRITSGDLLQHNITSFDLQKFWRKPSRDGKNVYQPIGLRSLMKYYFDEDIHQDIHSADVDARATMQLFREIYPQEKLTDLHKMEGNEGDFVRFKDIPTIK